MKKNLFLFVTASVVITVFGCKKAIVNEAGPETVSVAGKEALTVEENATSVPTSGLIAWYRLNSGSGDDNTTLNNNGTVYNTSSATNRKGASGFATRFNGYSSYIEAPDKSYLSINYTGQLTISVWMKVETLDFTNNEKGYVHWMGKGSSGRQEYVLRMYNKASDRPNRISCYAYNLDGGLGAGSYFQDNLSLNQWIHVVALYDYPKNSIKIYKNGILRDSDTFSSYDIIPQNGSAPLRIGTRDFASYFKGVLDDLRIYNRTLSQSEITALYNE